MVAKARGAKRAVLLPVSAPFHCALMKWPPSACSRAPRTSSAPSIPVLNNVDVAVETDPARIKDALVRQAYSRRSAGSRRCRKSPVVVRPHVFECGPGKVLAGMTKRIEGSLRGAAIADAASREEILKTTGPHEPGSARQVALVTGASRGIGGPSPSNWAAGATVVGTATSDPGAADIQAGLEAAGIAGRAWRST